MRECCVEICSYSLLPRAKDDEKCPCHSIKPLVEEVIKDWNKQAEDLHNGMLPQDLPEEEDDLIEEKYAYKVKEDSNDWEIEFELKFNDALGMILSAELGKFTKKELISFIKSQKEKSYREGWKDGSKVHYTDKLINYKQSYYEALTHFKEVVQNMSDKSKDVDFVRACDDILNEITKEQNK